MFLSCTTKWEYGVQYHQSPCTPRRASAAPPPAPQSKEQSGYLSFWGKKTKLQCIEQILQYIPHNIVLGQGCRMCTDCKAIGGKFVICDNGQYKINWIELNKHQYITHSVWNTYFCFFTALAFSTRPICTSCVTTCRRVRLLLLSNGSRVSTTSGTKHKNGQSMTKSRPKCANVSCNL